MEKKPNLTPELQAKLDEFKKAHGIEELSPDELDSVAGGEGEDSGLPSEEEALSLLLDVYHSFSLSMMFDFARYIGFRPSVVQRAIDKWGGFDFLDYEQIIRGMVWNQYHTNI